MRKTAKNLSLLLGLFAVLAAFPARAAEPVKLLKPNLERGKNIMQALSERRSTRSFDARELSKADLSDLLWAATGINRPDGRRTNPTAINKQEIDVYVCTAQASYLYDYKQHQLVPLTDGDARPFPKAPVNLVIVGATDFRFTDVDAGIVSQNISLFCSGAGLATVPRAGMDQAALKKALKLDESKKLVLNHPVGYFEK
ncbi:MAG: SagB/ThcOx family dehydrogenase [Rikenellaceae bacterium]|jgi:nitroreductase|nr:SagB/ThcOx family dehydrogenase [Rikenellaceae bacterium]